ncbi:hypothetical protein N5V81_13535 [Escherichia coli]|nr:hypothetical protein [Escherichia coli]
MRVKLFAVTWRATTMWPRHGHGTIMSLKKNSPGEFHVVFVLGVGFEHKAHELVAELMKADIPPLWDLSMAELMYPDDDFVYLTSAKSP